MSNKCFRRLHIAINQPPEHVLAYKNVPHPTAPLELPSNHQILWKITKTNPKFGKLSLPSGCIGNVEAESFKQTAYEGCEPLGNLIVRRMHNKNAQAASGP